MAFTCKFMCFYLAFFVFSKAKWPKTHFVKKTAMELDFFVIYSLCSVMLFYASSQCLQSNFWWTLLFIACMWQTKPPGEPHLLWVFSHLLQVQPLHIPPSPPHIIHQWAFRISFPPFLLPNRMCVNKFHLSWAQVLGPWLNPTSCVIPLCECPVHYWNFYPVILGLVSACPGWTESVSLKSQWTRLSQGKDSPE